MITEGNPAPSWSTLTGSTTALTAAVGVRATRYSKGHRPSFFCSPVSSTQ